MARDAEVPSYFWEQVAPSFSQDMLTILFPSWGFLLLGQPAVVSRDPVWHAAAARSALENCLQQSVHVLHSTFRNAGGIPKEFIWHLRSSSSGFLTVCLMPWHRVCVPFGNAWGWRASYAEHWLHLNLSGAIAAPGW